MMRVGEKGPDLINQTKYDIVSFTKGKGLDIGRGEYKAFRHFIGVREKGDDTIKEPVTPDFVVDSFDNLSDFVNGELDFIYVHGMGPDWSEQSKINDQAARLLKEGGYFINVWEDKTPDGDAINACFIAKRGGDKLVREMPSWGGSGTKNALVIRYGAIGDMMQSASVLPELKKQGYHITFNCHVEGELLLRHDPNIDAFLTQEKDQVPNEELPIYWKWLESKFDRVINLCESVEGSMLCHPGRSNYNWPYEMRKKYCNENYLEFMAEIAELPFNPGYRFYPEPEESERAESVLRDIELTMNKDLPFGAKSIKPYVIMWALAGSSVHKFYPHQDAVIARILTEMPNAHIILVGDPASQVLEAGWENESRVHRYSGVMPLRDVLALAPLCQLVIGPETGVLNAVAFETNAKIVLLSHSTEKNLTRDWTNTESLHSKVTPCYPCHRLHYNHSHCPQDQETGAAMCQVELSPADVWEAVQRAYIGWGTVRQLITP